MPGWRTCWPSLPAGPAWWWRCSTFSSPTASSTARALASVSFGVRAVFLPLRAGARFRDSTLRNAPLALVLLLRMMPAPLGLRAFLGGLVVIGGVEAWKSLRDPLGRRFGDVWAQTQVVDGKVVSGTAEEAAPSSVAVGPERWMSRTRDGRGARFRRRQPVCASR